MKKLSHSFVLIDRTVNSSLITVIIIEILVQEVSSLIHHSYHHWNTYTRSVFTHSSQLSSLKYLYKKCLHSFITVIIIEILVQEVSSLIHHSYHHWNTCTRSVFTHSSQLSSLKYLYKKCLHSFITVIIIKILVQEVSSLIHHSYHHWNTCTRSVFTHSSQLSSLKYLYKKCLHSFITVIIIEILVQEVSSVIHHSYHHWNTCTRSVFSHSSQLSSLKYLYKKCLQSFITVIIIEILVQEVSSLIHHSYHHWNTCTRSVFTHSSQLSSLKYLYKKCLHSFITVIIIEILVQEVSSLIHHSYHHWNTCTRSVFTHSSQLSSLKYLYKKCLHSFITVIIIEILVQEVSSLIHHSYHHWNTCTRSVFTHSSQLSSLKYLYKKCLQSFITVIIIEILVQEVSSVIHHSYHHWNTCTRNVFSHSSQLSSLKYLYKKCLHSFITVIIIEILVQEVSSLIHHSYHHWNTCTRSVFTHSSQLSSLKYLYKKCLHSFITVIIIEILVQEVSSLIHHSYHHWNTCTRSVFTHSSQLSSLKYLYKKCLHSFITVIIIEILVQEVYSLIHHSYHHWNTCTRSVFTHSSQLSSLKYLYKKCLHSFITVIIIEILVQEVSSLIHHSYHHWNTCTRSVFTHSSQLSSLKYLYKKCLHSFITVIIIEILVQEVSSVIHHCIFTPHRHHYTDITIKCCAVYWER